jgi:glycolate oxidase iron-sulfur subunit
VSDLLRELKRQEEKLFNCVHCGFCLPACPTYTRLGDEADSPRGRLHFMRAVVEGRLEANSSAFARHLDRCLGCRACESVCPSGVEYGVLLEGAREEVALAGGSSLLSRALARVMGTPTLLRPAMLLTRALRASGFPAMAVQRLPGEGRMGQARLGLGMIAATTPPEWAGDEKTRRQRMDRSQREEWSATAGSGSLGGGSRAALLLGCVQEGLLSRVNRATARVLEANGFQVVGVTEQGCCGAVHAHTGDLEGARALARRNIEAFERKGVDVVAVNAAGCGATMKEYGHLLRDDPRLREAAKALAGKVRDVSELLGRPGLRVGGPLPMRVTYDAPCHLLHAQRISKEPLALLRSIPGLELVPLRGHEECCGGAGVYGITHPELGGKIMQDKVEAILATGARAVATGNPGCMMQIGAGLRMAGAAVDVVHPVELLDESYRRGGAYP